MAEIDYGVEDLSDEKLSSVADAATALRLAQQEVAVLEQHLAIAKARVTTIEQVQLPEAMSAMGMVNFTLTNGDTIKVVDCVNASITEENQPAAFGWLRANGKDSIIKRLVGAAFGKGDDAKAAALRATLEENEDYADTEIIDKATVHASTLKSFVAEQLVLEAELDRVAREENGPNDFVRIPRATFGVYTFKKAVVKTPKVKG